MSDINVIEYKSLNFELKDVDRASRHMVGAYTAYNNKDSDGDIGKKGMFTRTWTNNSGRIKHLLNHDVTKPIGKPEKFWEDDNFAYYSSKIGTHKLGDDALAMAESGLLSEHSYGYKRIRQNKTREGNELLEVKMLEFSNLTGWGANGNTPLLSFQKSEQKEDFIKKMFERQDNLEKFCRNSNASDETIELLLLETKQLTQTILDISTEPLVESTLPDERKSWDIVFDNFTNSIKIK